MSVCILYTWMCVSVCILYIWMCVQGEHLVHCLAWIYMWAGAGKAFGHLQQFLFLCNYHLIATVTKHYFGILLCQYVVKRYTKESESAERRALSSEIERWRCGALRQQQASYSVFWPRKQSWSFSVQACFDPGNSRILSISYFNNQCFVFIFGTPLKSCF